ncbi:hypothetical protein IscW_ISCW014286 [Ixodes scapularis]|uniref:Uncharacterized protein n=1 Tax=Ixodes scapularis TaxID=6945 RepID=B7QIP2_IXOSC|nr:hypothetical protein IscW_ISCW014286 [Ixodes scapularis]|eukprot:XP_002415048.1 hypothetical protein IscW_ISCW014286 [Ixodes scapularis]
MATLLLLSDYRAISRKVYCDCLNADSSFFCFNTVKAVTTAHQKMQKINETCIENITLLIPTCAKVDCCRGVSNGTTVEFSTRLNTKGRDMAYICLYCAVRIWFHIERRKMLAVHHVVFAFQSQSCRNTD